MRKIACQHHREILRYVQKTPELFVDKVYKNELGKAKLILRFGY
jgi:hypothetical protein